MDLTQNKYFKIIAFLLPALIVFGNISLFKYSVAGVVLTSYRILIPVLCAALIWLYFRNEKPEGGIKQIISDNTALTFYCFVMLFWVAYGAVTLVCFEYSVFSIGLKEMLMLMLAALSVICILILCHFGCWDELLIGLRVVVLITLLIGVVEMMTGKHLPGSRYNNLEFWSTLFDLPVSKIAQIKFYKATSIFYNDNDFSAFLVITAPVFVNDICNGSKRIRLQGCLMLGLIYITVLVDDAFICLIAGLISIILALILNKKGLYSYIYTGVTLAAARIISIIVLKGQPAIEGSLLAQLNNLEMGHGSLLFRLNTYKVTFTETVKTSKGLGFGAGSFTNYFQQFVETRKMNPNPHCYWLEIFSEYGAIVTVLFIAFLIFIFVKLAVGLKEDRPKAALIMAMGTAFAMACAAPSSYLMNTYYWIPIGMAVYLADSLSKNNKSNLEEDLN